MVIIECNNDVLGGDRWAPYLELTIDECGTAALTASEELDSQQNDTTRAERTGRMMNYKTKLSYGSAVAVDRDALQEIAERVAPWAKAVAAGHETYWDGYNMVGRLTTDEAREADERLRTLFDEGGGLVWTSSDVSVWSPSEWLGDYASEGITADTTDDELEAIAEDDARIAADERVVLRGSTIDVRREARDAMRIEAAAE